jgi:hypothetical protein
LGTLRRGVDVPKSLLYLTKLEVEDFTHKVSDIKDGVSKGEFSEPTTVSMMTWSPLDREGFVYDESRDRLCRASQDEFNARYGAILGSKDEDAESEAMKRLAEEEEMKQLNYSEPAPMNCACGHPVRWGERLCKICGQEVNW